MAGWHHGLDGHESEWTPGDGDGQGGLVCCDSWGCRVGHDWATELNWLNCLCLFKLRRQAKMIKDLHVNERIAKTDHSTPGLPVRHHLLEFTQTHIHWVSDAISHLVLCRPLFLLPPIPPSIRVFSNESTFHMRWSKYWSFSFSIIPSKEIPGLISFRMDWLDLLAVQGTLKSLLQHHSSKVSILRYSAYKNKSKIYNNS